MKLSPANVGVIFILCGSVFSGMRPLFGRWLIEDQIAAVMISLYTYVASVALFFPIALREVWLKPELRTVGLKAFATGLVVGIGGWSYFEALGRLPVATVTLIYFTYPAFVIAVVAVLRRRWPQREGLLAVGCVIIGCVLIIGPAGDAGGGQLLDYAIAFVGPATWTFLILMLAGPLTSISAWSRIGLISLGSMVITLLIVALWQPDSYLPQTTSGWLGVLGLVAVSGVPVHVLFTLGVPKAGSERAAIAGVSEIVASLVVGWLILYEPANFNQIFGVVLICSATLLTRRMKIELG